MKLYCLSCSKVNVMKNEDVIKFVAENVSASATLRAMGLRAAGGNFKTLYRKILELKLNNSHWRNRENFVKGTWISNKSIINLDSILTIDSTYNRNTLKQRLLKEGLLKNQCYECGQLPVWNGKLLVLQLDHINGVFDDNRFENLQILCPNCHTQTDTFCAKRLKKPDNHCACGTKIRLKSKNCCKCNAKILSITRLKIKWPPVEEVSEMVFKTSLSEVGRKLGVSDNAVKKFLKRNGCEPRVRT